MAFGSVIAPVPAFAADTAGLTIQKSVSKSSVVPGETFNWVIEVGCSVLTEECINAELVDAIPPEFDIDGPISVTPAPSPASQIQIGVSPASPPAVYNPSGPGQTVSIDFNIPLAQPITAVGLNNQIRTITIPVKVRSDLPYTTTPIDVRNTADISADNATPQTAFADVTVAVDLHVATTAHKSFSPTTVLGVVGSPTTVTVGGTNTSNSPVDVFTIQDPAGVVGDSGIFATTLRVDALDNVVWPTNAELAVVSVWSAATSAWVSEPPVAAPGPLSLPSSVAAADIRGVRIEFSSSTPAMLTGETAGFDLGTTVRAAGSGPRSNTSSSFVSVLGASATATDTKNLTLQAASSSIAATKVIAPDRLASLPFGAQDLTEATVTLTARNSGSVPLNSMTISEPTVPSELGATNPFAPAHPGGGLTFQAFGTTIWPTGATAASITYYYADGSTSTDSTTTVNTLPAPELAERVTGFAVTFTGASMLTGAQAALAFTVKTNPLQAEPRIDLHNEIGVNGTTTLGTPVSTSAEDDAVVYGERLDITTQKSLTRTELLAIPGQQTTATLTTSIRPYPESSQAATEIVQYDPPAGETGLNPWYTYFNPTSLSVTSVPGAATLTVQYRDSVGDWHDIPGLVGITAPGSPHTIPIPSAQGDAAYGIRVVWNSTSGFVPGSTLMSNIDYQLRSTLRGTSDPLPNVDLNNTLLNCSSATGSISGSGLPDASASLTTPCPHVNLRAVESDPGPGGSGGIPVDKQFRGTNGTNVNNTQKELTTTRSSERTGVRLGWSTGGRTGITEMTITDAAVTGGNVSVATYQKGMYDAFDLVRINAINNTIDPLLPYDRVAVELFSLSAGAWVSARATCTQAAPCTSFTALDLSVAQRADTIGVRFIYTERPGRTTPAQPPGAGVAVSTGADRGINLVYEIRDTLRSDPTFPVVNGPLYNAPLNGVHSIVRNDVHASALTADGILTANTADTIQLQDANLALDARKRWTGGPLPILESGDTPPTSRVTLETINQTPASTISEITILDPNPDFASETPFEHFDLTRFHSITRPAGSTSVLIEVRNASNVVIATASGSGDAGINTARNTALGWSSATLADATSVFVRYEGRMAINASVEVQMDLALRTHTRTSGVPVTATTVDNGTKGTIADWRFDPDSDPDDPEFVREPLSDNDRASIQLLASSISVTSGKSFGTASQPEHIRTPISLALTGTPNGTQRVATLTLLDDRATFWNAFDFVSKGTITLPVFSPDVSASASRLRVEACTGAVFNAATIEADPTTTCEDLGGSWTVGPWLTQAQLTAGTFLPGVLPADVQGLRVTVKRADDSQWENPHAPVITINLNVQRRENLRSGGPVPSDYNENDPAPGESVRGRTTNGVTASVVGIWGSTAEHSSLATYLQTHQTTGVQVEKLPLGLRQPGNVIPYTLSIRNTGELPIVNPVITDRLPTDGVGAMLVFSPDEPTNYQFQVTGGSIPSGATAVPTGVFTGTTPGVVTIDVTTDAHGPTEIEFSFPAGTVIGVDQTVIVSVPLRFRPGLTAGTQVNNTFEIVGDRLFDSCTAPTGKTATTTSAGFGCTTGTIVSPDHAPALRAIIKNRAETTPGIDYPGYSDPNSQFTGADAADCRAAQDADGFSRPPCAPLTIPGQDSTWRLTVQNTGTTMIERLVVATRLPTNGDHTIVSSLMRDSRWTAAFNGLIADQFGPGATVTTYYTTATAPCGAVLQTPTDAAACGSDPATGWAVLPGGGLPDSSIVTGLQFVVDFAPGNLFAPASIVTVDIGTTTVASVSVLTGSEGSDPLAVNSLSVSGITQPGSGGITRISALDYSRAILSLATGSVTIEKEITGPAAGFIPGYGTNPGTTTFVGALECTSLGEVFTRAFQFTLTGGVITPAQVQIDNLPGGAECTATETAASAQTEYTSTTVIVDPLADPAALPNVVLTNDYQLTQFEIRKVATAPVGTIIPVDFRFEVTCSFLGQPITLAVSDAAFGLDENGVKVISGIPVNSICAVQETNNRGAGLTVVSGGTVAPGSVSENQATSTVTITGLRPQPPTGPNVNWAEFENRYDSPGVVLIEKAFAGGAAPQFGSDPVLAKDFDIDVVCTLAGTVQYDGTITLNAANGWSEPIPDPVSPGAECVFTEPDLNGADAVVFSPADPGPPIDTETGVIIVPALAQIVTVTATNWFLTGAIQVTKEWVGDPGAIAKFGTDPALSYEFTLVCERDGLEVLLPGGNTRTVDSTAPIATYTGIASGADCQLTETESNGAFTWTVVDINGDPVADGEFTIVVDPTVLVDDQAQSPLFVENEFQFADVSVAKTIDLYRPGSSATGPFEVELVCTLDGRPIDAAEPAVQTIVDLQTVTWTELAAGADCIITETDTGGALATGYRITDTSGALTARTTGDSIQLAPLRLTGDAANHAEFINSYALPSTGGTDSAWLAAPVAALFILFGIGGLVYASMRPRRTGRHALGLAAH